MTTSHYRPMTDRELLEMAAKAAEIQFSWIDNDGAKYEPRPGTIQYIRWNPLIDDGDALRLAIKMNMRVSVGQVDWCGGDYIGEFAKVADIDADPYAATRRAIVSAAAAIERRKE